MSLYRELNIIVISNKTGKEMGHYLKQIPNINEAVVLNSKLYRVIDKVWHSDWHDKHQLFQEVRLYVSQDKVAK